MNLRQLAQGIAADTYTCLKKLPVPDDLRAKCPVFARSNSKQRRMTAFRQKRLDLYNEVQWLKAEGMVMSNIALHLQRNYITIRTYFQAETFPERMPRRAPHSILMPYVDYLDQRFEAGYTSPSRLLQKIHAQGYSGSVTLINRWLKAKRILAGEDPAVVKTGMTITNSSAILPPQPTNSVGYLFLIRKHWMMITKRCWLISEPTKRYNSSTISRKLSDSS